jgi:hypothetical protein
MEDGAPRPLQETLISDIVAAVVSAGSVTPFITIIDKAIFSNASGKQKMLDSLRHSVNHAASHPIKFIKSPSFLWIWGV